MIAGYFVAASGMIILIFLPNTVPSVAVLAIILYTKFGVAACYNLSYIGNGILFDPAVLGTTIGLCTASSRLVTATGKPISSLNPPVTGKWVYEGICAIGALMIVFLIMPKKESAEPERNEYDKKLEEEKKALIKQQTQK